MYIIIKEFNRCTHTHVGRCHIHFKKPTRNKEKIVMIMMIIIMIILILNNNNNNNNDNNKFDLKIQK